MFAISIQTKCTFLTEIFKPIERKICLEPKGDFVKSLQLYREPPWANSIIRQTGRIVLAP